jgi:hypothetical protein
MPSEFREMYDQVVEELLDERGSKVRDCVVGTDKETGRRIEVGTTVFADDICETKQVFSRDDAFKKIKKSGKLVDKKLGDKSMARNTDKEVHIVRLNGQGAAEGIEWIKEKCEKHKLGLVKSAERYLGNIRQYDGSNRLNIERRKKAAKECFYSMGRFWKQAGVGQGSKRLIYKCLVEGTLMSGLEAEVLSKKEWKELETWNLGMMRKALSKLSVIVEDDGTRRQLPNATIRGLMGTHTLRSIWRERTLKWYGKLRKADEADVIQLRTAVGGDIVLGRNREGVVAGWAPWAREVRDVLLEVARKKMTNRGSAASWRSMVRVDCSR